MSSAKNSVSINVRGIELKLMTYTRSLELCARMNYETENLDFIDAIPKGDVMYDLGACEGRFSVYAALKGINVISFEPEKRNYGVFMENIELNFLDNAQIVALNYAVGEKGSKGTIKIGQPWEGGHQKVVETGESRDDLNFEFKEIQSINIISLDELVGSNKYPFPSHLKIDVDGSEITFLKGATQTLQSPKLIDIIFELNKADKNFDYIIKTLHSFGFSIYKEFKIPNEPTLFNIIFKK